MKSFLCAIAAAAIAFAPSIARADVNPSEIGLGPHGYDWQIGSWSCTNSMAATPLGGPSTQTETVSRSSSGTLLVHVTGDGFDYYSYSVYDPANKMWTGPFILADGTHGSESTAQTGPKIVWTGTSVDPSGKTTQIRDTEMYSATSFHDLGESLLGGTWKAQYRLSCTKT